MNGLAYLAQADFRTLHHRGDIPDVQCGSIGGLEQGLFNVVDVAIEANLTDIDLLLPFLDKTAAGVGVVVGQQVVTNALELQNSVEQ